MGDSVKFDVDSPASRKLIELAFQKLKESFDPNLQQDALAQYAVALVAKGWERKKVFNKLKELLGDEDACNMLLDWLMPYVRTHRNELVSSRAPTKAAAPATSAPAAQPSQAAAVSRPAPAAAPKPAAQESAPAPIDDVEALLQEELPSDMLTDLEEEEMSDEQGEHTADSPDNQPQQQPDGAAQQPATTGASSKQLDQRLSTRKSAEQPKEEGSRRARIKSVIQWSQPAAEDQGKTAAQRDLKLAPELEARRARFQAAGAAAAASDGRASERERGRDRERDRERDYERERERDADGSRGMLRDRIGGPSDGTRRGGPEPERERRAAGLHSRSRSPPGGFRDRQRAWEPHGRDSPSRDKPAWHPHDRSHPHERSHVPTDRRRPHVDVEHISPRAAQASEPHGDGWSDDRAGPRSPHGEPGRPRLRSVACGSLDGTGEIGAAPSGASVGGRVAGFGRLLGRALDRTGILSRVTRPAGKAAALRGRLGGSSEAGPDSEQAGLGPRTAAAGHEGPAARDDEDRPKSIFERLNRGRHGAGSEGPQSAGVKRPAASHGGDGNQHETMNGHGAERSKVQRTEPAKGVGSTVLSSVRAAAQSAAAPRAQQPAPAAAQPVGAAVAQAQPTGSAAATGLRAKVAAQIPLLPGGKVVQPRQAAMAAGAVAQARERQAAQLAQQAAAAAAKAVPSSQGSAQAPQAAAAAAVGAKPSGPVQRPASAAAAAAAPRPVGTAGAVKANGVAPAPAAAMSQMEMMREELRRKALEIERIKGQIALKEVCGDQQTMADARSVIVQGLHPHVNQQMLAEFFIKCGAIANITVKHDHMTQMVCAAYIQFETLEAHQNALSLDRTPFMGQILLVKPKPTIPKPTGAARVAQPPAGPVPGAGGGVKRLADAAPLSTRTAKTWTRATAQSAT